MSNNAKRFKKRKKWRGGANQQCTGKQRYKTWGAAQAAVANQRVPLRIYKCEFCKELHVTGKDV